MRFMFNLVSALVVIIPVVFGLYMLLTPGEKLVNAAKRGSLGLPMPEPGTKWFKVLVGFYRFVGMLALVLGLSMVVIGFIEKRPEEKSKSNQASHAIGAEAAPQHER